MANPLAVKGGPVAPAVKGGAGAESGKAGPSGFDKVRETVRGRQAGETAQLPPAVTQVSAEQKRQLEADLRKRLQQARGGSPREVFRADMKKARTAMQGLSNRIEALPKTSAFEPVRTRFAAIENQFRASGKLLNNVGSVDSPRELLKVQMQMYQLTQNIEIVSKVVEQVNAGVKQILQTQV